MIERRVPSPFVELLAGALDEVGAGWYLFNAQAALIHGAARLTADVDVTIHLRGGDTRELVKALIGVGFQVRAFGDDFLA